ncbi:MAG: methylated-DNA--[protein]-cysteine S-methyltransferase [Panacagrimonas sp.]
MSAARCHARMPSPIGELLLVGEGDALVGLYMIERKNDPALGLCDDARLSVARQQLEAYFAGRRTSFELELRPMGTDFQRKVWAALREIPFGETISYGELARRIGQPSASRAVGLANGQNPISIIVPCHRVIGANGSLTGYGGGIERKRWLLAHEARGRSLF